MFLPFMLVVDANSPDGTGEKVEEIKKTSKNIELLKEKKDQPTKSPPKEKLHPDKEKLPVLFKIHEVKEESTVVIIRVKFEVLTI